MFNTFGRKERKYGGALPVWIEVTGKMTGGATLRTVPPVGTVVPSGTPVLTDKAGGTADTLEFFRVEKKVEAAGTEVQVLIGTGLPVPAVNDVLMKVPDSLDGTGTAVTVKKVVESDTDGYKLATLTLSATLGELPVGTVLTVGAEAGADKKMKFTSVSGLTENDIWVEEGTTAATCAVVDSGRVMADRIQPIPDIFKALLPNVKFEKGI